MTVALALDLGGTHLRAALAECGREGEATLLGTWPASGDLEGFRSHIEGLVEAHRVTRIGLAIPGLASGATSVWVPNLPWLDGCDLDGLFPGVKVALGNDAQFALLAEAALGAAQGVSDAILIAIGTGLGSAVLADGRIVRGYDGAAASFGWACADPEDAGDKTLGWLERNASGTALDTIARRLNLADGRALIAASRGGDAAAHDALRQPAAALGATLAGAVALLGSRRILVSGGVADGLEALAPMILPILRRQLPPRLRGVTLTAAEFGPRASLVGAALAAHDHPLWTGARS